jgi:hypothetical protein
MCVCKEIVGVDGGKFARRVFKSEEREAAELSRPATTDDLRCLGSPPPAQDPALFAWTNTEEDTLVILSHGSISR